jgi:cephalosporin-C deacetylase-like acetyl esterase
MIRLAKERGCSITMLRTHASIAGHPTGEHSEASVQTMLTGDHIARYFVWDALRGIDYLTGRRDIDSQRIGAFGCSGGGTVTAYLAALDDRVKAAEVACYITSYDELLPQIGPQEAEQTIPGFIEQGLGFADWVEMAAPRPYAIISTTEDMFPFAGARESEGEARRIYTLYGAEARLAWITGPGRHGNLRPVYAQIMGFFLRWLSDSTETPEVEALPAPPAQELLCTRTGQVSTSLGGATVFTLNRERAGLPRVRQPLTTRPEFLRFRERLIEQVRRVAGISDDGGVTAAVVRVVSTEKKETYRVETVAFPGATGIELTGRLAIPDGPRRKPGVLLLQPDASGESDMAALAGSGDVVLALQLLPGTKDEGEQKSALLGPFYLTTLRALLVGKTLVGLRAADVMRAADWLASRADVDSTQVEARGKGADGIVLLHAALLDERIRSVRLEQTLVSYRMAVNDPAPRDLAQSVIPGVLRHYDLDDLVMGLGTTPVTIVDPIDAEGKAVSDETFRRQYGWVLAADRNLHEAGRLRVVSHSAE